MAEYSITINEGKQNIKYILADGVKEKRSRVKTRLGSNVTINLDTTNEDADTEELKVPKFTMKLKPNKIQ